MKEIAIIGSTASGKTALSLDIAQKTDSIILSLDSLAVYKEIDIASAKPTKEERGDIVHFGIDEVYPNETFDVMEFVSCYKRAKDYAQNNGKNLIIVGGTGFYLKVLLEGISHNLRVSDETKLWVQKELKNLENAYDMLYSVDKEYMQKIERNDRYRVEKALTIFKQSGEAPSIYFEKNKKEPISPNLELFEIQWDVEELRKRIALRTSIMIKDGVIDEVIYLEKKYTREPNCMASIGIVETLDYLDGNYTKQELEEKISTNTARLAKRQRTFNRSQFGGKQTKNIITDLSSDILKVF